MQSSLSVGSDNLQQSTHNLKSNDQVIDDEQEIQKYFSDKKMLYTNLMKFLEDSDDNEDNFVNLNNIININHQTEDRQNFEKIFQLLTQIAKNFSHH